METGWQLASRGGTSRFSYPVVIAGHVGVVPVLVFAVAPDPPGDDADEDEAAVVLHDVGAATVARACVSLHAA